jgi:hypothetical protein
MDYRLIAVSRISWCALKACYGAGKVQFQTPPATYCSRASSRLGPGARDLVLHHLSSGFRQFIQDIETSAEGVLGNDLAGRQLISAVTWDGEMRLTLFEKDTLFFDRDGELTQDIGEKGTCACLVSLIGIWTSARSWGLKFAIKEMKEVEASKVSGPKTAWAFREDVSSPPVSDWLFRDD